MFGLSADGWLALAVLVVFGVSMGLVYLFFSSEKLYRRLRPLSVFRRVETGLALAMEEGRRLHYTLGRGDVLRSGGGASWAGLSVMGPLVRAALRGDAPPLVSVGDPGVLTLAHPSLRRACVQARAPQAYSPDGLRLAGMEPASYGGGAALAAQRGRQAMTLVIGHVGLEAALLADTAPRLVGGTDHPVGQAVLLATGDDALIGEEVYAAGAYMRTHPMHAAGLWVQDAFRWLLAAALGIGGLIAALSRLAGAP